MKTPSATILASTHSTAQSTLRQLQECYGDAVKLRALCFDEIDSPHSITDDCILITNPLILDAALNYIVPGTPYFITSRAFNVSALNLLFSIPEGSEVLLVNVSEEIVNEALQQFKACGIEHVHFYPYYPGIKNYHRGCHYALLFGDDDIELSGEYEFIQLNPRVVSASSCVELAMRLGIYPLVKDRISLHTIRPGIHLSMQYANQLNSTRQITASLNSVLSLIDNAVISVTDGIIHFSNRKARQILQIEDGTSPFLTMLTDMALETEGFFFLDIQGISYYIDYRHDREHTQCVFIMDEVKDVENKSALYRNTLKKNGLTAGYQFTDIIHNSSVIDNLIKKARQFALSQSNVIIYGESGCGKELFAQAIHNASQRKKEAFVAVNFASLSPTLCESELFGYVGGAFTGAKKEGKKGLFELANNGTIFLDEIGDCPPDIQKKLLRVIQERCVMPLGSTRIVPLNIRVIAATNCNLPDLIEQKKFREDLYYRLHVLPLNIPPLRERKDDILPLFLHFLNNDFGMNISSLSAETKEMLLNHSWRGNVRELRNTAEFVANCISTGLPWKDDLAHLFGIRSQMHLNSIRDASSENKPVQEDTSNGDYAVLWQDLEEKCEMSALLVILQVLDTPPRRWSIAKIVNHLNNPVYSTSLVKKYLSILKEKCLVQSRTGVGTYLNQRGKDFYYYAKDK